MPQKLTAEHGAVCSMPNDTFGYFGWPSVTRMDDGTLVAAASGLRNDHVCPFGKSVIFKSFDAGNAWTSPRVVNDSPLDDRDTGIISLGGRGLLLTWFTSDNRKYLEANKQHTEFWKRGLAWLTDDNVPAYVGAWLRRSLDGGDSWEAPIRVPLTTPHGPIRLSNGELLFFGKEFGDAQREGPRHIRAMTSADGGQTWSDLGAVPICEGTNPANYHEPHVVELPSGKLVGHIRFQSHNGHDVTKLGLVDFSIMQTESTDGGRTWSAAQPLGFPGSPPHLLRHSSGVLACLYGYRLAPFGQRVAISRDEGATWQHDFVLRDDGPDGDLGYPCSVELDGGEIFTVYYQKPSATTDKCALLWSRWRLPE